MESPRFCEAMAYKTFHDLLTGRLTHDQAADKVKLEGDMAFCLKAKDIMKECLAAYRLQAKQNQQ